MRSILIHPIILAGVLSLAPAPGFAATVAVDCSGGTPGAFTTITAALAALDQQGPHTINVTGTCTESVSVFRRERLTIQASLTGATIEWSATTQPALGITGSNNIVVRGLTVRGSTVWIDTSTVAIDQVTVVHSGTQSVMVVGGSTVRMTSSVIEDSTNEGLGLEPGASAQLGDVTVRRNTTGIVTRGATLDVAGEPRDRGAGRPMASPR